MKIRKFGSYKPVKSKAAKANGRSWFGKDMIFGGSRYRFFGNRNTGVGGYRKF